MRTSTCWTVLGLLCIIELIAARTLEHHQVITSPNGDKVTRSWTTHEDDETTSDDGNPFDEIKKITDSLQRENTRIESSIAAAPNKNAATIQTGSISLGDLMKQGGQVPGVGPIPIQELMNTQGPLSRTYVDKDGQLVRATYGMPSHTPAQFADIFGKGGSETDQVKPSEWEWATPTDAKPITNIQNQPNHVRVTQHWQTIPQPYFTTRTSYSSTPTWTSWSSAPADKDNNAAEQDKTIQPTIKLPVSWQWNSTWSQPPESFNWNNDFDATDTQPADINTKWTSKSVRYPNLYNVYPSHSADVGKTTTATTVKPKSSFEEFPEIIASTTSKTPIKKINIEDLPVTAILQNGKPADEEFLKTLPAYLRPVQQPKTISTENIPMSTTTSFDQARPIFLTPETEEILRKSGITEDDIKASNGEPITRTRLDPDGKIVRTTYRVSNTPTISLGPMPAKSPTTYDIPMITNGHITPETEEILRKSGITEADIKASNGEPITRTRVDPDGKIVRTTYRISNTPTVSLGHMPAHSPTGDLTPETEEILRKSGITEDDIKASNGEPITRTRVDPDGKIVRTTYRVSNTPTVSLGHMPAKSPATHNSPVPTNGNIANFLAKLGMGVNDIRSRPGQKMTKSIVDEDGNILTATFLYSSVKNGFDSGPSNIGGAEQKELKPIK